MKFSINVNDSVKVKLTEHGIKKFIENRLKMNHYYRHTQEQIVEEANAILDNKYNYFTGYHSFQMHDLMEEFSDYHTQKFGEMYFENNEIVLVD